MNPRKKNLLEALRNAGEARVPGVDDAPRPEPAKPARAPAPKPSATRSAPRSGPRRVPAALVWATALGLSFVVGLVVGRQTTSLAAGDGKGAAEERGRLEIDPATPVGAELAGRSRAPASSPATRPAEGAADRDPPATGRAAGAALFDSRNQYTLVIANYGKTRDDYAWATYEHLREHGVSVFPPVERTNDILVLAGAAATTADLTAMADLVHGLEGWDGNRKAYADAYVARIDSLIKR